MNRRWCVIWLLMGWLLVVGCSEGEEDLLDSEPTPAWWKAGRQAYV
ncbi:hypothetical protein HZF02_00990 [Pseudomonas yamanorum]|nr:hypothetical protein HZF02_00990 [Pseudomonas yamanorum]